uniref:1-deoxy-D-xylulose-5-phosphate reductoisomerase n=1 Tax=freshwater metagenome TaxID=449393 RepID=A0A6J5ZUT8_9ZZZZ
MRKLILLGSTGSIGTQAIDVVGRMPEMEVIGLSAGSDWRALLSQARALGVSRVAIADPSAALEAAAEWDGEVLAGSDGLAELIAHSGADIVCNAIVGAAGLAATVVTLTEGIDLALANKESLVVGGELVVQLAEATGARLLPVDSEHSALHQLIEAEREHRPGTIDKITLTASGGPFRGMTRDDLQHVTLEAALQHPTWEMGGKITIDSATLMNKGLEIIEAHHLFGTPYERISAVIHPQSIVHSMISLCDGASLAHLGYPDMRVPIAYALSWPDRTQVPVEPLDLARLGALTFEEVDHEAFPCLGLATAAGQAGGSAPCILNAANEVAVAAFLGGECSFLQIPEVIDRTLTAVQSGPAFSFEALVDADRDARAAASDILAALD